MLFKNGALVCLIALAGIDASAQTVGGCPVFPSNNIWNARVDGLPVHPRSAAWVGNIGPTKTLHQDFGAGPGSMPITYVTGSQPKVVMNINPGAEESDPGPYPFPPTALVEAGSDGHVLVVDTTNCMLYETYDSVKNPDGSWNVYSGAIFDLRKNLLRPQTYTSADAAGLPILPGLARFEEILEGEIRHALRFTAPRTTREFLWPARHFASSVNDPALPSMGARFRLKASFDITRFTPATRIILTALKKYGMMLADNGSSWYIQGAGDPRWPDLADEWRSIPGSAFEGVDTSPLMDDVDSAAVKGATVAAPTLQSAALLSATVAGGQGATLRVTLSGSAGVGGLLVSLSSGNGAVATLPASVLIPEGSATSDVAVTTMTVAAQTAVTFTASLAGLTRQDTLTVTAPAATLQSAAWLGSSTVTGGQPATLRITLSGAAPAGGTTIALSSGAPGAASVAGPVQISSGSSSADVPISSSAVQVQTQVTITATLAGVTRQAVLTVNPAAPAATLASVALGASLLTGGVNTTLQINLSAAAPSGGATVVLSSTNAGAAGFSPSVNIPAGSSSIQVPVTTTAVGSQTVVTLTATLAGIGRQATLTVNPPTVLAVAVSPGSVQGGAGAAGTITLNGAAPPAGLSVTLVSSNTSAATVPSSVMVSGGQTAASFPVATLTVPADATVRIQAATFGQAVNTNLEVKAAAATPITLGGVSAVYTAAPSSVRVTVTLSAPAGPNGALVTLSGNNESAVAIRNRQINILPGATAGAANFAAARSAADATLTIAATLGSSTRTATVSIPKVVLTVENLRAGSQTRAGRWTFVTVTLSGPALQGSLAPAVTLGGVFTEQQWVVPISPGRSSLILAVRGSAQGTGTVAVTYGGVTKSVAVTVQ